MPPGASERNATSTPAALEVRAGPLAGLRAFLKMWRKILTDSDFGAGCPALAASVEDPPDDGTAPREAATAAFSNWTSILAESLVRARLPHRDTSR
jgi:hypothetical protein